MSGRAEKLRRPSLIGGQAGAAGWAPANLAPEQRRDGRQIVDMSRARHHRGDRDFEELIEAIHA
jgi:hypothetical protein